MLAMGRHDAASRAELNSVYEAVIADVRLAIRLFGSLNSFAFLPLNDRNAARSPTRRILLFKRVRLSIMTNPTIYSSHADLVFCPCNV
jgi:hypothetical protein